MSQRIGSTINSPFFMADPILAGRGGDRTNSFITKGDDPKPTNDVFLVTNQAGASFKLNRGTLKETLVQLKEQAQVSVRNLSPQNTESFKSVVEALRLLHGSQALYDMILNDIREVFSDINDIKPGTIASFFIGCFNDDKFPGSIGCSPKCASSLPPTEGTPGYNACDDLVLIYENGQFSSLNEKRSTQAFIYIGQQDFVGFTPQNIQQLTEAGVERVVLIYGTPEGKYREVTSAIAVDALPKVVVETPNEHKIVPKESTTSTTSSAGWIVLGVLILLVIVLFIMVYLRGRGSNPMIWM